MVEPNFLMELHPRLTHLGWKPEPSGVVFPKLGYCFGTYLGVYTGSPYSWKLPYNAVYMAHTSYVIHDFGLQPVDDKYNM